MNIETTLKIAFGNLKRQKIRSFLTILAIVIGMSTVVMFVVLGTGLQQKIDEQFKQMGVDKIYVVPGSSLMGSFMGGTSSTLTEHDEDLINRISGVEKITGMVYGAGRVAYGDEQRYFYIIGMPIDEGKELMESMQSVQVAQGRYPKETEKEKVMVGYLIIEGKIFEKSIGLGKKIEIEGRDFEIVGSFTQIGNSNDDTQIYLPIEVAREILDKGGDEYDTFIVQADTSADVSALAEKIKEEMRQDRDLKKGEEDFSVETTEDLIKSFNSLMSLLSIAVVGLASISLLVGGIGIMNTMYTSVLDRTQEIGVMKAIGATDNTIMAIFISESGLLGLVGGIFGVLIGLGLSYAASFVAETYFYTTLLGVYLNPLLLLGILLFSFGIGCVSGVLPARRAAKMEPVEALRYE